MSGEWLRELQPASWQGLPFQVKVNSYRRGRKIALHEYPFRDDPWAEDLGRSTRGYRISGFVVGDDCHAQAQALLDKSEIAGPGILVHPSLGTMSVTLISPMEANERWDLGRVVEIGFEFVASGQSVFPATSVATDDASTLAASAADTAVTGDWLTSVTSALGEGAQVIEAGVATVQYWAETIESAVTDASLLVSSVAAIPGNFGRFLNGAIAGVVGSVVGVVQTVEQATTSAISSVLGIRQDVIGQVQIAVGLVSSLGTVFDGPTIDNGFCGAVQATTETLRTACVNPADAVRLLASLAAQPQPTVVVPTAPIGVAILTMQTAMQQVFIAAALTSLARACATYQPSSYDDTVSVIDLVAPLYDAEILVAADAELDSTYQAMRTLRAAVVADLLTRGGDLARLTTITTAQPTPSLTLAYRLYQDATRADDLAARAAAMAPLWMPTSFQALSA